MRLTRTTPVQASQDVVNERRKSIDSQFIFLIFILVFINSAKVFAADVTAPDPTLVEDKYSLKADLEAFAEVRKNIPEDKRKENDERAFMDQMMSDLSKSPSEIRNRFSSIVYKKRNLFNKDMIKARESFSKNEKKMRDEFNKEQSEVRKSFQKKKVSSEERKEFFEDVEAKRKDFYLDIKEKRDEFEADVREKRRNFDDYIRSKTDEFNQLHRDYIKRYEENKKSQSDFKKQAAERKKNLQKELEIEYETIKKQSPIILQPYSVEGHD